MLRSGPWIDCHRPEDAASAGTEQAYGLYALFYAPIALLAYWIVWRGNIRRHIRFFRESLRLQTVVVDLATGDGSLTSLALFGSEKARAARIVALDISEAMLRKARRKLPPARATLVRGDVRRLPFAAGSVKLLTCFGGFNSFPSGLEAMREMARTLAPRGRLRGSVLLMPDALWRRRLIMRWIRKGYQSEAVAMGDFLDWTAGSGLELVGKERNGDVLLFDLKKSEANA